MVMTDEISAVNSCWIQLLKKSFIPKRNDKRKTDVSLMRLIDFNEYHQYTFGHY